MGEPAKMLTGGEINPDDLEPTIGIDLTTQKKILRFEAGLSRLRPHELLGVGETPTKKEIRSAYFARMTEFHTDRFFGKELGNFGARLTKITDRLTAAQEQLTREAKRRKQAAKKSIGAESSPPQGEWAPIDVRATGSMPPADERVSGVRMRAAPKFEPAPSEPASPSPTRKPRTASRRNLARRLASRTSSGVQKSRPVTQTMEAPEPPRQMSPRAAAELKARFMSRQDPYLRIAQQHRAQAERHIAERNWRGALMEIAVATQHAPDDPSLQQTREEIETIAYRHLAPQLMAQADKSKRKGHVEAAVASLERAARGKQSARLYAQGAEWLLELPHLNKESSRFLVHLAKRAVELERNNPAYHLVLAQAYGFVGMAASAVGEAKRVLSLDPQCEEAKALLMPTK